MQRKERSTVLCFAYMSRLVWCIFLFCITFWIYAETRNTKYRCVNMNIVLEVRNHFEQLGIDRKKILKCILKSRLVARRMNLSGSGQEFLYMCLNFGFYKKLKR
jgi:hypothetical protein